MNVGLSKRFSHSPAILLFDPTRLSLCLRSHQLRHSTHLTRFHLGVFSAPQTPTAASAGGHLNQRNKKESATEQARWHQLHSNHSHTTASLVHSFIHTSISPSVASPQLLLLLCE